MPITIVVAEDHRIVRQGIRWLLEEKADARIVGETGDGLEVVRLTERLLPDIVVMDLMMTGLSGIEATREIQRKQLKTRVIMLTMYANEAYVIEAIRAGASGYVVKQDCDEELVEAIHQVMNGGTYFSAILNMRAIREYLEKKNRSSTPPELTPREREILRLTAEGLETFEISERLVISFRTLETHRANIMRKLELRSGADLVRYALREGPLSFE